MAGLQEPLHETEKEGGRLLLHTSFFPSRAAVYKVLVSWQSQRWAVALSAILPEFMTWVCCFKGRDSFKVRHY